MKFEPIYTITNKILNNISGIESARSLILNSPLIPAWERKFKNEAFVRTIHYSTHIENNPLTYKEVSAIVHDKKNSKNFRIRDFQEIINYRSVLDYIDKLLSHNKVIKLDEDLLLEIHKIISKDIIPKDLSGVFRKVPVVIMNSKTQEVSYRAPKFKYVPSLIKSLFLWYNSEEIKFIHPVIKAGILHTQIARIHPFVEANGRTSRLVATLSLLLDNYDIKRFFCLDEHYDRDLPRYYESLQSVENSDGDMTFWLEYFSEGLFEELNRIKERVVLLSHDSRMRAKLGQIALTDRQLKILSFIQDHGYINNKEWRNLLPKFSDDTILRDLKVLINRGLVKKTGRTKSARYLLKD